MPEISVVIPTYNRLETLTRVLPTLLAQDLEPSQCELLVCDSNSTDGTAEYLAGLAPAHRNLRHLAGPYSGRASARNAGIAQARAGIVLFNDADIFASPDLLSTHLRRHRERSGIAVVGLEVQVRDFEEYEYKRDHPEARGHLHPPSRRKLSWLYFLTGYGHEDLELGYRLQRLGVEILYEPLAVNYHCQDVAYGDQKEKMRLAGRSTARFYRKHPHVEVMLNLGMTPLSLWAHAALSRLPLLLGAIDRSAERSRLARELLLQYHYVSGIKEARDRR